MNPGEPSTDRAPSGVEDSGSVLRLEALESYLDAMYGQLEGYAAAGVKCAHIHEGEHRGCHHWQEASFRWPAERDDLLQYVSSQVGSDHDVYLCPYVLTGEARKKGTAVERRRIHADIDSEHDLELLGRLGELDGYAVRSGSEGHAHVYVDLDRSVTTSEHESLCRALGAFLGAVDAKISDNDLLRPPGTWNYKHDPRRSVSWLLRPTGHRWQPEDLAEVLDASTSSETDQSSETAATAVEDLDALPGLVRVALDLNTGDRSEDTMRVVGACHRAGLTLPQTRSVVVSRGDLAERLEDRSDDDIARCWSKVAEMPALQPTAEAELTADPRPMRPPGSGVLDVLRVLLRELRRWQHLPDPLHIIAVLAAAATRLGAGEPTWLLLVGPPSSGKTEAVRLLDQVADARLDEVTAAGLLGWNRGKPVRATGVLTRIGSQALVTFGDLSGLLATSDRGGRDQVFALLRRIYDGHASRDIAPPAQLAEGTPQRLEWSGRLTIVGCVTQAIDRFASHTNELGARWLYLRLPERTTLEKRSAAQLARQGSLEAHRRRARELAAEILSRAEHPLPELSDELAAEIEDAALVTAWGRGSVPRSSYGPQDIEGLPVVEEPMRLVQQLSGLARGVLALGLPERAAATVVRRVSLDSMPEKRRRVLSALADGEVISTSEVGRRAHIDRKAARFTLEELQLIGVVGREGPEPEDGYSNGPVNWFLDGDDGRLIANIFTKHREEGWDEVWLHTSTSPPSEEVS